MDTANGYVMCNLGTLASNAVQSITIQGMVDPAVPDGVFLINNAMVMLDNFDDDNSDNAAQSTTSVESTASLGMVKLSLPSTVVAGESFNYRIVITNAGPSTAKNVVFLDQLPAGVALESWTVLGAVGACSYEVATNSLGCGLGDLAPWTNPDPDVPQVLIDLQVRASGWLDGGPGAQQCGRGAGRQRPRPDLRHRSRRRSRRRRA